MAGEGGLCSIPVTTHKVPVAPFCAHLAKVLMARLSVDPGSLAGVWQTCPDLSSCVLEQDQCKFPLQSPSLGFSRQESGGR